MKPIRRKIPVKLDTRQYMESYCKRRDKLQQEQQEATEKRLKELPDDEPFYRVTY